MLYSTKNCKFDYYYNTTVPPVILDGGRDVLLANFHGPRSLKCSSVNGCLAKPAPENTFAVVNREFLYDCQLDLEHANVQRQFSSCSKSSTPKIIYYKLAFCFQYPTSICRRGTDTFSRSTDRKVGSTSVFRKFHGNNGYRWTKDTYS